VGPCRKSYVDYGTYLKNRKCVGPSELCLLEYNIQHGKIDFGCIRQSGGVVVIDCNLEVNAPQFIRLDSLGTISEKAEFFIEMIAEGGAASCNAYTPQHGDISMSASNEIVGLADKHIGLLAGDACACDKSDEGTGTVRIGAGDMVEIIGKSTAWLGVGCKPPCLGLSEAEGMNVLEGMNIPPGLEGLLLWSHDKAKLVAEKEVDINSASSDVTLRGGGCTGMPCTPGSAPDYPHSALELSAGGTATLQAKNEITLQAGCDGCGEGEGSVRWPGSGLSSPGAVTLDGTGYLAARGASGMWLQSGCSGCPMNGVPSFASGPTGGRMLLSSKDELAAVSKSNVYVHAGCCDSPGRVDICGPDGVHIDGKDGSSTWESKDITITGTDTAVGGIRITASGASGGIEITSNYNTYVGSGGLVQIEGDLGVDISGSEIRLEPGTGDGYVYTGPVARVLDGRHNPSPSLAETTKPTVFEGLTQWDSPDDCKLDPSNTNALYTMYQLSGNNPEGTIYNPSYSPGLTGLTGAQISIVNGTSVWQSVTWPAAGLPGVLGGGTGYINLLPGGVCTLTSFGTSWISNASSPSVVDGSRVYPSVAIGMTAVSPKP
tara:strand:- start:1582 stop:3387 length:1806 start_codon:yes stop_codon:yes gene_type:complete